MDKNLGNWAFILCVVIAIVAGIFGAYGGTVASILILLGILVGLANITQKEMSRFLMASIALLAAGAAGLDKLPIVGRFVGPTLFNIATFVAPAAVIIALKEVYAIAHKK